MSNTASAISKSPISGVFVGTASSDQLFFLIDTLSKCLGKSADGKMTIAGFKQQGGVGLNAMQVFLHMAQLLQLDAKGTLVTNIGNNNADDFLNSISDISDFFVNNFAVDFSKYNANILDMDAESGRTSFIKTIPFFISPNGKRLGLLELPIFTLCKRFARAALSSGLENAFTNAAEADKNAPGNKLTLHNEALIREGAAQSDIVTLTSRKAPESLAAALAAKDAGKKVLLDLNSDYAPFIDSPELDEIIRLADYVVTPEDTVLPCMTTKSKKGDKAELLGVLQNTYGKTDIAISDGAKEVDIHTNGELFQFQPPKVSSDTLDFLGCGDARTGAAALGLSMGMTFSQSVIFGTCVSSATANYFGRSWANFSNEQSFAAYLYDSLKNQDVPDVVKERLKTLSSGSTITPEASATLTPEA